MALQNDAERINELAEELMDIVNRHLDKNNPHLCTIALGTVAGHLAKATDNPWAQAAVLTEVVKSILDGSLLKPEVTS